MSERNFSDDVKINKYKLEEECEKQAGLYFYWAEKLADARSSLNEEKDKLDFILAEMDTHIRIHWDEEYPGMKSTETSIKSALEQHPKIQKQKEIMQQFQREVNTLFAAESAMNHRKSELDNLVTLLVKGFYAAPNGGKREDATATVEREVRKKLNKGKE